MGAAITTSRREAPADVASPDRPVTLALKRALDLLVAGVALVLLAPVLLVAAIAVRWDTPGPVIYRAQRLGRDQRPFTVYKLRSMHATADDEMHLRYLHAALTGDAASTDLGQERLYKLAKDPRVTRVGRILRRTSIDEIPQLLNVLQGHMSLIGPRPEVPYALEGYEPWQLARFDVRPGLTGLWQVSGRSALTPLEMLALDVTYAETWTLGLDLRIALRTPRAVMGRVGAA